MRAVIDAVFLFTGSGDFRYRLMCWIRHAVPAQFQRLLPEPILHSERRLNAVILLQQMGLEAKSAVPVLIGLLDQDEMVQSAMNALVAIGPAAKAAVPRLLELLEDNPSPFLCLTLKELGADPSPMVPALRRCQTKGPRWLRIEASTVLREVDRGANVTAYANDPSCHGSAAKPVGLLLCTDN